MSADFEREPSSSHATNSRSRDDSNRLPRESTDDTGIAAKAPSQTIVPPSAQRDNSRLPHWVYVLWALPVSAFSIFLLPLALTWPLPKHLRATWRIVNGALEISSPLLLRFLRSAWFRALTGGSGFAAATIGHVIIGRDAHCLHACRIHEHVHVRQCERWGPLFPFAYIAAGLYAVVMHRSLNAYYWHNAFEVEARAEESRVGSA